MLVGFGVISFQQFLLLSIFSDVIHVMAKRDFKHMQLTAGSFACIYCNILVFALRLVQLL